MQHESTEVVAAAESTEVAARINGSGHYFCGRGERLRGSELVPGMGMGYAEGDVGPSVGPDQYLCAAPVPVLCLGHCLPVHTRSKRDVISYRYDIIRRDTMRDARSVPVAQSPLLPPVLELARCAGVLELNRAHVTPSQSPLIRRRLVCVVEHSPVKRLKNVLGQHRLHGR